MEPQFPTAPTPATDRTRKARESGAAGSALFAQQRHAEALICYRQALEFAPSDPQLHFGLACAALALGDKVLGRIHILKAIEAAPSFSRAHDALARLLHETHETEAALKHSAISVQLEPAQAEFHLTHALLLEANGQHADAWDAAQLLLKSPGLADRAISLCTRVGPKLDRVGEAVSLVEAALAGVDLEAAARRHLHFAAATLFDRVGRYDEAFEQARMAHQMLRRPYDAAVRARQFSTRIEDWTAACVASLPRATHGSDRPVFIVGMPRSGTSLVEQILGCHPEVFAGGELTAMNKTAQALDSLGVPYPRSLEALTIDQANQVAGVYLRTIETLNPAARRVTDKMPLNFMYLDLVHTLLPESRIIHCIRDAFDTCLSCYLTEFEIGYDFADDLKNLGAFYRDYRKIVAHWKNVLPLKILEVRYEEVVEDLEGQARRMVGFLELPWDDRCLRFHESSRAVNTASREQVRQPIYTSSVGRWKKYAKHLEYIRVGLGM